MGGAVSKVREIRVRITQGISEDGKTYKAGDEARVLGPAKEDGHVELVFDNGQTQTVPRSEMEIISEDLSAGMRVRANQDSSDEGKWYKAGDEGEVLGRSKMGPERVEVRFDQNPKRPQQPPRSRLDVLSNVQVPGCGMKTVILARHGRAEHNDDMWHQDSYPDAWLTELGVNQATSWSSDFLSFAVLMSMVELILVSPLRRTVQTACHMFANESTPMQLCMPAREAYWKRTCNQPITVGIPKEFEQLLTKVGQDIEGLTNVRNGADRIDARAMIRAPSGMNQAADFEQSVKQLRNILQNREENTIAVVTHGGTIKALTGEEATNCMLLECVLFTSDNTDKLELRCVQKHATPYVPKRDEQLEGYAPAQPAAAPILDPNHPHHHDPARYDADAMCDGSKASERVNWLMKESGMSHDDAVKLVLQEFPKVFWWRPAADCDGSKAQNRAKWLMDNKGLSKEDGRLQVRNEFPKVFGFALASAGGDFVDGKAHD